MNSDLNLASASDLHLGHRRNPVSMMIQNLGKPFSDNAEFASLDVLFLAGDVFDDLLVSNGDDLREIDFWISDLLRLCKKHDVMLRILEGTGSHDWQQSRRFETLNTISGAHADVLYVKTLHIENIKGYNVLYVPDEWHPSTDVTLVQVKELIRAKGLTSVDIAIMHGQFDHQLPPAAPASIPRHNGDEYLKLVKRFISIGHVHVRSRREHIFAQGSFDRMSHGEEGKKGYVRATLRANGRDEFRFVDNDGALEFVTVHCGELSLEETIEKIDREVEKLQAGAHVRVVGEYTNPIFANMDALIRRHPLFNWSKNPSDASEEKEIIIENETLFDPIAITRDNIQSLLLERMAGKGTRAEVLDLASSIIERIC
jgi:DNA repair exonuclease SbcCD nuclease subunit